MIDRISANQATAYYQANRNASKNASTAVQQEESSSKDTLNISTSSVSSGIYSKPSGAKVDRATVSKLEEEVAKIKENLRSYVLKLISSQGNAQAITMDTDVVTQAKQAISEDGEWGIKAVSDRIVEFAKAISGNDKSKLETLKAAIEKGFQQAGAAFNNQLPSICSQTHDEVMKKLDAWVNED
ncbi:hypothetical protein [Acetanaerobacterium elongatum]|uniref:DUF5610 domain-containing protein n=1 Tax=Acetanaerobacterium elongatum TaxID=258515 RepID=A0A1H0DVZ3_9FIRM|nr:hypothetical protein [Acetanaerobacterium elongatum]SDN74161.1 hypothetical protein SAMN05192585_13035 [Acetanaerobacterium elongatum]